MSGPAHEAHDAGFRLRSHTADAIVEAHGPTRAGCLRQAILGLVALFADTEGVSPTSTGTVDLAGASHEEDLVELLEEVVFRLDTEDLVVVDADIAEGEAEPASARLHLAPLEAVEVTGAAPKAIAWSQLELGAHDDGVWHCRFLVDV